MKSKFREIAEFVIITAVIVIPIRLFVAQPFIVSGASMDKTFLNGQYLVIDELTYHFSDPKRGEVVVFKYPLDPSKYFIKRVIGIPGDTVIVNGNKTTVKTPENPAGSVIDEPYTSSWREGYTETFLKAGEYFVMGDNRAVSLDSRVFGTLPRSDITGRVFLRLFPPNLISIFPGKVRY